MDVKREQLEKSEVRLTITVPAADMQSYVVQAAVAISKEVKTPGFRPGNAPVEVIAAKVGRDKLWAEAVRAFAVPKLFEKTLREEKIDAIGQPKVEITKEVVDGDVEFRITFAVLPHIALPDLKTITVQKKETKIEDKDVDRVLEDLRKMRAVQITKNEPAQKGDRVEIDFLGKKDNVPFEGGAATNYGLVIGEGKLIPGFEENLIGMKAGEKKTFPITFPKEYPSDMLKGAAATFDITMKVVQKMELPPLDDAFAVAANPGTKTLKELREVVRENLKQEAEARERDRYEMEVLEAVAAKTTVEIPEVLIEAEVDNMIHELEHQITRSGGKMVDYLGHIKKTMEQLRADQHEGAKKRVLNNLIVRQIGIEQKITADAAEVDLELAAALKMYEGSENFAEISKAFDAPEYRERLQGIIRNRKTIGWLTEQVKK